MWLLFLFKISDLPLSCDMLVNLGFRKITFFFFGLIDIVLNIKEGEQKGLTSETKNRNIHHEAITSNHIMEQGPE